MDVEDRGEKKICHWYISTSNFNTGW